MAPVNPKIQATNDPSYGNNSRPVDVPDSIKPRGVATNEILPEGQKIGDKSAAFEGEAAGYGYKAEGAATEGFADLFSNVAKVGDFLGKAGVELVKKDIENRVYDIANKEREDYTAALEQIKNGVGTKNILDSNASADEPNGSEVPNEVSELPDRLDNLTGARDAGKIPNSYYQGRLLAEAKQLRAKYPGFRQEIDDAFAKVTGSNPANAYVRDLVSEINKNAAQAKSLDQKTLNYIRSNIGVPGAVELYNDVATGKISGPDAEMKAVKLFAPHEALKVKVQEHKAIMDDVNISRDEKSYQAEKIYDKVSGKIINDTMGHIMQNLGLTDDASVANVTSGLQSGAIDPKQWEAMGQRVIALKARLRGEMLAAADRNGVTENIKGGKPELLKRIDASLSQFDTISDLIYKKDTGALYSLQRDMAAQFDQDKRDTLGSKAGPMLRQIQIMKDIGGQNYMTDLNLSVLRDGSFTGPYQQFFNRWSGEIASQSNYGPNGKPSTFNDMFDDMKQKGVDVPKASNRIINQVTDIANPKVPDPVKENLALSAFSPGNAKMISRLNPDGVDSQGRQIQGQNAVYQKWTSPEMTKEIHRLGQHNPQIWQNYVQWAENTLGSELINREVQDFNKLGEDPNLKISWDSDNKRFGVKYVPQPQSGRAVLPNDPTSYAPYVVTQRAINRINSNLSNFKNIADASGQDVETFLLKTLRNIGGDLSNVRGIPAQMIQQIDATRSFEGRFGASQRRGR